MNQDKGRADADRLNWQFKRSRYSTLKANYTAQTNRATSLFRKNKKLILRRQAGNGSFAPGMVVVFNQEPTALAIFEGDGLVNEVRKNVQLGLYSCGPVSLAMSRIKRGTLLGSVMFSGTKNVLLK